MTPFSYKGARKFNTTEGEITLETIEGFLIENVIDWVIGKTPTDETEQLVIRLKNTEDKDVWRQFPILDTKKQIKAAENKFVRRNENSIIIITDPEAILKWKAKMI